MSELTAFIQNVKPALLIRHKDKQRGTSNAVETQMTQTLKRMNYPYLEFSITNEILFFQTISERDRFERYNIKDVSFMRDQLAIGRINPLPEGKLTVYDPIDIGETLGYPPKACEEFEELTMYKGETGKYHPDEIIINYWGIEFVAKAQSLDEHLRWLDNKYQPTMSPLYKEHHLDIQSPRGCDTNYLQEYRQNNRISPDDKPFYQAEGIRIYRRQREANKPFTAKDSFILGVQKALLVSEDYALYHNLKITEIIYKDNRAYPYFLTQFIETYPHLYFESVHSYIFFHTDKDQQDFLKNHCTLQVEEAPLVEETLQGVQLKKQQVTFLEFDMQGYNDLLDLPPEAQQDQEEFLFHEAINGFPHPDQNQINFYGYIFYVKEAHIHAVIHRLVSQGRTPKQSYTTDSLNYHVRVLRDIYINNKKIDPEIYRYYICNEPTKVKSM